MQLERINTSDPQAVALEAMARAAHEAADTYTLREWAGRLAARAGPRDYRGQLAALMQGIAERWRYVAEQGEWVPGSARAVLGQVLGLNYAGAGVDPLRARIEDIPIDPHRRGWGDCDDVSTLVAAGVLALGMKPLWRVVRRPDGAHVSVTAITPRGESVELDAVAHDRPFGWAVPAKPSEIQVLPLGAVPMEPEFENYEVEPFAVQVAPNDVLGDRVLALPDHLARRFNEGYCVNGCPAVDQFGDRYAFDASRDLWRPLSGAMPERTERRRRIVRRWQERGRKVAAPLRKVGARVLNLPAVQQAIASSLAITGTPIPVTLGLLRVAAGVLQSGGIAALYRLAKKNPRAALQLLAQQAAKVRGATPMGVLPGSFALDLVSPDGRRISAAPVRGLVGLIGAPSFGSLDTAPVPAAGRWYRVKAGDTLLEIAKTAYGAGLPGARWIANASANAAYRRPPANAFEKQHFPSGLPSFKPQWANTPAAIKGEPGNDFALLWLPTSEGIEPPPYVPDAPFPAPLPAPLPAPAPPAPLPQPPPPAPVPPAPIPEPAPAPVPAPPGPPAPPGGEALSPAGLVGLLAALAAILGKP